MSAWKALRQDKTALVCMVFLLVVLTGGIFAPFISPYDPLAIDTKNKLATCSGAHWLGTDHLGRDIFSRLLYGIRMTLGFSVLTTGVTISLGTVLGVLAGFLRGRVEKLLMRLCDIMISFPGEVLILSLVGLLGPSIQNVILACILAKWPWYTRMIRTITQKYAGAGYIVYAHVVGYGTPSILLRHVIPNAAGEIIVLATVDTGAVILLISALSFLGLGVQPPAPEWGAMLAEARNVMVLHPWQMLPPGIAILSVAAACNLLGDSLRDALDPRHRPAAG